MHQDPDIRNPNPLPNCRSTFPGQPIFATPSLGQGSGISVFGLGCISPRNVGVGAGAEKTFIFGLRESGIASALAPINPQKSPPAAICRPRHHWGRTVSVGADHYGVGHSAPTHIRETPVLPLTVGGRRACSTPFQNFLGHFGHNKKKFWPQLRPHFRPAQPPFRPGSCDGASIRLPGPSDAARRHDGDAIGVAGT